MSAPQLATIDFTDLDKFAGGSPRELFALHRRLAPVFWHQPTAHTPDTHMLSVVANAGDPAVSDLEVYLFFQLPSKRRTATRRATLGGQTIEAGQKVLVWEGSANRDPAVFDRVDEFDITRKPNPHIGFGHGVHFCLGAHLARLEMRVRYEELLSRFGEVALVAPVEWTRSNRHTGMRHMMVELRP